MKNYTFDDIAADLGALRGEKFFPQDFSDVPCREISSPEFLEPAPLVSVIMLAYDHEAYIARAIESVVCQKTAYPFELLIGEDHSPDRTMEIVLQYQRKYPKLIRVFSSEKNVGVSKNIWRLYRHCRGKYWAFCEGDDLWTDERKLDRQCRVLEEDPEVGLVFSDCASVNADTGETVRGFDYSPFPSGKWGKNVFIDSYLNEKINVYTCSAMIRALGNALEGPSVFTYNVPMGDVQLWCTAAKDRGTYFFREKFGQRNMHTASLTATWNIFKASISGIFVKSYFIHDIYGMAVTMRCLAVKMSNLAGNIYSGRKRCSCPSENVAAIIRFVRKYRLAITAKARVKLFLLWLRGLFKGPEK